MEKRRFDFVIASVFLAVFGGALYGGVEESRKKAAREFAEANAEKPMDLTSRMDRAEKNIRHLNGWVETFRKIVGGPIVGPEDNPVPPTPKPGPKPDDGTAVPGEPIGEDMPLQVLNILTRHCKSCHAGASEKGGKFAIFKEASATNDDLADLKPLDLVKMDYRIYSGMCPPEGKLVSGEDYATLRAWISAYTGDILKSIGDGS